MTRRPSNRSRHLPSCSARGFLERVAETLSNLTDDHDGSVGADLQDLVDLVLVWNEKHRDASKFEVTESPTPLEVLEAQNHQLRVGAVARNLGEGARGSREGRCHRVRGGHRLLAAMIASTARSREYTWLTMQSRG